jgi:DNA-binding transcriptional LysR family regulator
MDMDLRQLRYFVAVAEERHLTRAAERLGTQQPPLSRLIKRIERDLDVQLFHRKARGVELTEAGRALFEEARAILTRLEHAVQTTQRTARGEQGRLRLAVPPTGPFHPFVPRVIRTFREAFPRVSVTIEESLSNEVIDHLRRELIDVGFLRAPVMDSDGLAINTLLHEPMVVALPRGHRLARMRTVSLEMLADETFILYGGKQGPGLHDATIAACLKAGFRARVAQEAPRITSTLGLVATGLGISLVPASLQRMTMDGLVYRPLRGAAQPKAILSLACRRGDGSVVVRQFLNAVRRASKTLR